VEKHFKVKALKVIPIRRRISRQFDFKDEKFVIEIEINGEKQNFGLALKAGKIQPQGGKLRLTVHRTAPVVKSPSNKGNDKKSASVKRPGSNKGNENQNKSASVKKGGSKKGNENKSASAAINQPANAEKPTTPVKPSTPLSDVVIKTAYRGDLRKFRVKNVCDINAIRSKVSAEYGITDFGLKVNLEGKKDMKDALFYADILSKDELRAKLKKLDKIRVQVIPKQNLNNNNKNQAANKNAQKVEKQENKQQNKQQLSKVN